MSTANASISFDPSPTTSAHYDVSDLLSDRPTPDLTRSQLLGHAVPHRHTASENVLEDGSATLDEAADPDRLFGVDIPSVLLKREKPLHRIMLYMKLRGASNVEIADHCGVSPVTVSTVTNQPWFRLRLTKELHEAGTDGIRNLLRSTLEDSILTQVELRDSDTTPAAVKARICDSLIDRNLGKAVQPIESEVHNYDESELDSKIERLTSELTSSRTFSPSES